MTTNPGADPSDTGNKRSRTMSNIDMLWEEDGRTASRKLRHGSCRVSTMRTQSRKSTRFLTAIQTAYKNEQIHEQVAVGLAAFDLGIEIEYKDAINNETLEVQQQCRRKHYGLLSLQLFLGLIIATLLRKLHLLENVIQQTDNVGLYCGAGYTVLLLISSMFLHRRSLNWICLVLLTIGHAILADVYRVVHKTRVVECIWGITGLNILVMTFVSTIPKKTRDGDSKLQFDVQLGVFISPLLFVSALFLHLVEVLDFQEWWYVMAGSFVALLWFVFDAHCIRRKLNAGQILEGILFFYTDMLLGLIFTFAVVCFSLFCAGEVGKTSAVKRRTSASTTDTDGEADETPDLENYWDA